MHKNRPKLLVVDDEAEYCSLIKEYFSTKYDVSVACDGEKALRSIDDNQPDCILMDLKMPTLNGLDTLKSIKSSTLKTPVIIVSASGSIIAVQKCFDLGAFDYILKPVNLDELEGRIISALKINKPIDEDLKK